MSDRSGNGLIVAGSIVSFIGAAIILVKVLDVPQYAVPFMVGIGLLVAGIVRRLSRGR